MLKEERPREGVALTVPSGPQERPAPSGSAVPASPHAAASSTRAPGQRPPGGDLCFHGLLSQVSVVSDETRSASRGSPTGLLQVTA